MSLGASAKILCDIFRVNCIRGGCSEVDRGLVILDTDAGDKLHIKSKLLLQGCELLL